MKQQKPQPQEKRVVPLDWNEIHRRVEAVQETIEKGAVPTATEKKSILRARAKLLAIEPTQETAAKESLEVVEFLLAYEHYGIELSFVREIFPLKELTPVPCTPPFVLGIVNVRGQILSVIDLKKFFDLPEKGLTDLNKVIILHSTGMEFGILADAIMGVRTLVADELQPSLPTLTDVRVEYLKGISKEQLVVLDAAKLLSDKKIIVHEEIE